MIWAQHGSNKVDFNPRTSYEVRLAEIKRPGERLRFQSTHLLRGATQHASKPDNNSK